MKILQVSKLYNPWIGGVEKIAEQIAENLNKKDGFEIKVLSCRPRGIKKEEIINGVKSIKASSLGIFLGMPLSFSFFNLFKKLSQETDLITIHHPFPLADLALFFIKPEKKIIVHYHSDIVRQKLLNFLVKPLVCHTLKKASKIIVSSPNLLKNSSYLKNFKEKCEIIPFGVDLNKFKKNKSQEQKIRKIKEKYGKNLVLFVGRIVYYKGLKYLIEAMKNLEADLLIIGEGPLKKNLQNKAKKLGGKNRIYFLPFLPEKELISFYYASDVLVLPSIFKSEAFGIVLIEAMACKKPIISTELDTGTSFVNQTGITGFVVPPKDSKALTLAIKKIIKNKKIAEKIGQNAYSKVIQNFSLEKMLEKIQKIYQLV